jgi:hypothetical protein
MTGGSVKVAFFDGSSVSLSDAEVVRLCELLWHRSSAPGAVAIIGMLEHERRHGAVGRSEVRLNERESAILLETRRGAEQEGFDPPDATPARQQA